MRLTLKDEFVGVIVNRTHPKMGQITFNPQNVSPSKYKFFYENGFEDLFNSNEMKQFIMLVDEEVEGITSIKFSDNSEMPDFIHFSDLDKAKKQVIDYKAVEHDKETEEE